MTTIKFCGLTRPGDAAIAAELGATHGGVVLAPGSRQVSARRALDILDAAPGLRRVGVFRHARVDELLRDATTARLDVVQLHGGFSIAEVAAIRAAFDGELWTVVPVAADGPQLSPEWPAIAEEADAVLLDTSVMGSSGGTGVTFHWQSVKPFAEALSRRTRVIVAGGLTASNVAEMIKTLGPAIADVSSGVEASPGIKDRTLMAAFAEAVGSASIV